MLFCAEKYAAGMCGELHQSFQNRHFRIVREKELLTHSTSPKGGHFVTISSTVHPTLQISAGKL
jgi:hypothetical protein